MRRLVAAVILVASFGATTHADAYACISTYNACKYASGYIKHVNNGIHH